MSLADETTPAERMRAVARWAGLSDEQLAQLCEGLALDTDTQFATVEE